MIKIIGVLMLFVMMLALMTGCRASSTETDADAAKIPDKEGTMEEEIEYKVAIVQYADGMPFQQIVEAVKKELDRKGEMLGVTFHYEDYTYNGEADLVTLDEIATDLLAEEVDLILPVAAPTVRVLQDATKDTPVPIVFAAASDPVGSRIVTSMNKPGANITGVADMSDTNAIFNLILTAHPGIEKIGLLYDMSQEGVAGAIEDAKAYCDGRGIEYVEKTGSTSDEIVRAADALIAEECEAVFTPIDYTVLAAQKDIYGKFIDAGIAQYTGSDSFAWNGAFLSYGVDYETLGVMAADMAVDVLIRGAEPATTPVKIPKTRIITINTEAAAALGIDYTVFEGKADQLVEVQTVIESE